jgi:uncharacterized caspase-like protein
MRGHRFLQLAVVLVTMIAGLNLSNAQTLEKRIALVVGNSGYQAGALTTPANDAGLIAQTLQAAGFDVVGARDLDAETLRSSLREFLNKASTSGPDTVAMVYFAGYALQFEGENYLVPIDARIAHDSDVPLEAVRVTDLTKPLAALALKARIVILDAARANNFAQTSRPPLAGGLALMQPDAGTLIAFNATPGTIGPESKVAYGAYATALVEMIKEGGLPLDDLFERVRLRVSELTNGNEITWHASRIQAPFLFFERTATAPAAEATRFAELRTKPIRDFDARDAFIAALARDTLRGYTDFLAAYPDDPLAKRVRAILAARREAATWRESAIVDTPDAYWSYLRRYPRGPHAGEADRRLTHLAAALEPPPAFTLLDYDVPPPPPDEIVYVERPAIYFADPTYDFVPPPPVPFFFLPPPPSYFAELPPPPPPIAEFLLPIPVYHPVALWVERPAYVAPAPINIVNVNIHNTIVVNQQTQTVVITNPAGQQVAPLPANLVTPQAVAPALGAPAQAPNAQNFIKAHPVASTAIAVALPAAATLRAQHKGNAANTATTGQAGTPSRAGSTTPSPAATLKSTQPLAGPPALVKGAQPLPAPAGASKATQPSPAPAKPLKGAQPLPTPNALQRQQKKAVPVAAYQRGQQQAAQRPALQQQAAQRAAQQRAQQQAAQRAALRQQAAQRATQQRAQQQAAQRAALQQQAARRAAQQRVQQQAAQRAALQQQAAQRAAQQRAQQQAAQRVALQRQAAQRAAQQRAQQQAALRAAAHRRPICGHPGQSSCH